MAALIKILNFGVLIFVKIKKPKQTKNSIMPLSKILIRKKVIIAILAASVGYSLMSFIMTATPLQIVNVCKLGDSASATVIQWHVIAMFAPSFFTGSIVYYMGNRKVMIIGVMLYIISICFAVMGQTIEYFWTSLFLCGLGWNILYVGGK